MTAAVEIAPDVATAAIADLVVTIQSCCQKVKGMLDNGMYDVKLASHLAWLTRELGKIVDRERKHTDGLTSKAILARLRRMDPAERDYVVSEIQRTTEGKKPFG